MNIILAVALSLCATHDEKPVPGATIIIAKPDGSAAAATSGEDGCATVEVEPGTYRVTIASADGLLIDADVEVGEEGASKTIALKNASEVAEPEGSRTGTENGELREAYAQELVVTASRERVEETRRVIEPELARLMPGSQGDALKAVQNMPGLARTSFGAAGLVVRGAAPQDTKVFLDGQEIPQLYHFGGLTSVVATDMLESIDFLPGGYGVRYGGAIAGVVDVSTKGGDEEKASGHLDADVYDAEAVGQTPIENRGRIIGAVRRSYIDTILPSVVPADLISFTVAPRYYDYQLRYDAPTSESGRTSAVFLYGSDDMLSFVIKDPPDEQGDVRGRFLLRTRFHRLQTPVTQPLANGWVLAMTPGAGWEANKIVAPGGGFSRDATRTDGSIRTEARGKIAGGVQGLFGVEGRYWKNDFTTTYVDDIGGPPGSEENEGASTNILVHASSAYDSAVAAAYAQAEITMGPVTVIPGLRVDGYYPHNVASVDPRIAARLTLSERSSLKAYAGMYHQAPQFQEWDDSIGNEKLKPPYSLQTGFGGKRKIGESNSIEGEVFWKWMGDLVVQKPGNLATGETSTYTNDQIGRAYGAEVLARREMGEKVYGFVAYTLSRSERADPYHAGGWRSFSYDQTHILTTVLGTKLSRGWTVGARFRYVTGNPTTEVTGAVYDADRDTYAPVNSEGARLPAFHQLDVRFDKTWTYASGAKLGLYLDLQNAYARENVEGVSYDHDYENRYWLTGLPVLPSVGIRGEF